MAKEVVLIKWKYQKLILSAKNDMKDKFSVKQSKRFIKANKFD